MRNRVLTLLLLLAAWPCLPAAAAEGQLRKVLPHLLDRHGRQSLSPSLYERDAYQAQLRRHPEQVSGLRFNVQWQAGGAAVAHLKLRVEVLGSKGTQRQPLVLEASVTPDKWGSTWSAVTLDKEKFQQTGEVTAWRVTLWDGEQQLAEQKSFLW